MNSSDLLLNIIRILAIVTIVVGATLSIAEFSVISSAVAQATGDNATMTGGNMTGNMTSGNATVGNASGSVSSLCGYRPC